LVREALEAHIACLKTQLRQVEREIILTLRDEAIADSARRLQSIPGIGEFTTAWLLTSTLNFQFSETPEQVVSYAGLAPYERRSGTSLNSHASIGGGGNHRLRTAIYMAAVSAVRWNPIIRAFHRRLRERGKPAKVAMCAAARKLLTIAWAIVTKQRMYDPDFDRKATLAHQRA
jgi:transposase